MEVQKVFSGKLNLDDVVESLPDGDYTYLKDGVIGMSFNGKRGSIENMVGSSIVNNYGAGYKCIGGCRDTSRSRHFLFLCDTLASVHKIVEVKQNDDGSTSVRDLYSGSYLNFDIDFPVQATYVNNYIYYTDNYDPIKAAKVWDAGQTTEWTNLIRRGGLYAPTFQKQIDSSVLTNLIRDSYFQFAYQYVYNNNEVSVLSPYSTLCRANLASETASGYNKIVVSIPANETIPSSVKKIRFAARLSNSSSFQYIGSIDRSQSAATSIDFYNSVYSGVVEVDYELNVHEVPLTAKSIEFIKNRLWIGNLVEGYNVPPSPGMGVTVTNTQYANVGDPIYTYNVPFYPVIRYSYVVAAASNGDPNLMNVSYTGSTSNFNGIRLYSASQTTPGVSVSGQLVSLVVLNGTSAYEITNPSYVLGGTLPGAAWALVPVGISMGTVTNITRSGLTNGTVLYAYRLESPTNATLRTFYQAGDEIANNGEKTFPNNSTYKVGIVYKDSEGRSSSVVLANDEIRTPTTQYSNRITAQWTLPVGYQPSIIPSWATSYQIVSSKNLTKSQFFEFRATRINYYKDSTLTTTPYSADKTGIKIDVTPILNAGIGYSFVVGDVAVLYKPDGVNTYSIPIKEVSGGSIILNNVNIGDTSTYQNAIIEIYRPSVLSEETFFYEVGSGYPITQPGTEYRSFSTTTGTIPGDCYNFLRDTFTWSGTAYQTAASQTLFKQMSLDVKSITWNTDHGKIYLITDKGQVTRPYTFRHSGTFIDGTEMNGLSEFYAADESNIPYENGEIMKLKSANRSASEGTVLLGICRERVASIYIGETRLNINTETSFLVTGSQIIGEVNTLQGWYGTNHPSSVFDDGKSVYWYSQTRRAFVKYSQNGIFPISEFKVTDYFSDISSKAITDDSTIVSGGYFPMYELIMVTTNHSGSYEKTISYSDDNQGWVGFHSFSPEYYMDISDKMLTFYNGKLFRHDNEASFGTHNGVAYSTRAYIPVNNNYNIPKFWECIKLFTCPQFITWSNAEQIPDLTSNGYIGVGIQDSDNESYEQWDFIQDSDFEVYESILYARLSGNLLDVNHGNIYDRDDLISRTALIDLRFRCDQFRYITFLSVGFTPSYGHSL